MYFVLFAHPSSRRKIDGRNSEASLDTKPISLPPGGFASLPAGPTHIEA